MENGKKLCVYYQELGTCGDKCVAMHIKRYLDLVAEYRKTKVSYDCNPHNFKYADKLEKLETSIKSEVNPRNRRKPSAATPVYDGLFAVCSIGGDMDSICSHKTGKR